MNPSSDYLRAAHEVLVHFPGRIAAFHQHDQEPISDSPASREREQCSDLQLLDTAYAQGSKLVFLASTDHMDGLARSLTSPTLSCTPYTCARVVLEACSTAIWLMDSRIHYRERIERSLNLRLDGVRSQGRFRDKVERQNLEEDDEWLTQNPRQGTQKGIEHLRACAKRTRIPERRKGDRFIAFGSGIPNISDRIRMSLDAEVDYSILSSVTHANTTALLQLSGNIRRTGTEVLLEPGLDPARAVWLVCNVVEWHARAAWACFRIFGRPLDDVIELLGTAYDQLGIKPEFRFWTKGRYPDTAGRRCNDDGRAPVTG